MQNPAYMSNHAESNPKKGQAHDPAYESESCLLDGLIYFLSENQYDPVFILQGVDVL